MRFLLTIGVVGCLAVVAWADTNDAPNLQELIANATRWKWKTRQTATQANKVSNVQIPTTDLGAGAAGAPGSSG